jgi:hypothetical protein
MGAEGTPRRTPSGRILDKTGKTGSAHGITEIIQHEITTKALLRPHLSRNGCAPSAVSLLPRRATASRGNVTSNTVPLSASERTSTRPPCICAISRVM